MTQDQFFDFEREGIITTRAGSARVFFISTRGWAVIEKQLYKIFMSGASVMLTEMGVGYGRGVAKEVLTVTKEPYLVLKTLEELSMAAGWGSVEVEGEVKSGSSLEVRVTRCAFCAEGEKGKDMSCHFLAGVCAGTAEEAYGRKYVVKEEKCIRAGDPLCVMSLKPKGK